MSANYVAFRSASDEAEDGGGDVDERLHVSAEVGFAGAEGDEGDGVARVAALSHRLDVAVVGRHEEGDAGGVRVADERG